MKKKLLILSMIILGMIQPALSQEDTATSLDSYRALGLEHLNLPTDSSRMKVISAGRISRNLDDLPLSVYVVTHEEIMRNQFTTLSDVLNGLPGILVSRPGTGELGESFQIWNLTGNLYTKILINGVPVKPSVVSGMPIGSQLPIRQAEKIEIIYGNSSAIYGADAVSGVINIITREADRGTFAQGDISLGRQGHNYINFTIGGKGGKNNNILQYAFYGSKYELNDMNLDYNEEGLYNPLNYYQTRDAELIVGDAEVDAGEIDESTMEEGSDAYADFLRRYYGVNYEGSITDPEMEALGSEAHMLGMQLKFKGFWLSYNYMYRRTHSSLGLAPAFYKYNNPQNFWGESIQQFSLAYEKQFRRINSTTQLNVLGYEMDNNSSLGVTFLPQSDKVYRFSASNDIELSQVFSASPLRNSDMVAGLSYMQSGNLPTTNFLYAPFDKSLYSPFSTTFDSTYTSTFGRFGINPIVFANISGFLQYYQSWRKFRILGGIRYDLNTEYGQRFSPQLAISHRTTDKLSFRLSLGTAYKAPPMSLKYQSLGYPLDAENTPTPKDDTLLYFIAYPNSSLRPERFNTTEFGFHWHASSRFSLEQSFFFYRITNHIGPRYLPKSEIFRGMGPEQLARIVSDTIAMWANFASSFSNVGGSQTTLRFNNIIRSIRLNIEASLYFQARQDALPDLESFINEYITLAPRHYGKLKVSMQPADQLYIYLESHWMSKWLRILIPFEELYAGIFGADEGYYAMNGALNYYLSNQLNVFVKVTNIFDEKYPGANVPMLEENLAYNPQLRRTIRAGLSYRFN